MKKLNRNRTKASVLLVSALLTTSIVGANTSHAQSSSPTPRSQASATAMETYKAQYAGWLVAVRAWNAARVVQISNHLAERNSYMALASSNQSARAAINAVRVAAITLANNAYAVAIVKSPSAAQKAALLATRTAASTAATNTANAAVAALPPLGAKPVWPVAATRPVKPVKPATTVIVPAP